jgi:hypothetical protein
MITKLLLPQKRTTASARPAGKHSGGYRTAGTHHLLHSHPSRKPRLGHFQGVTNDDI